MFRKANNAFLALVLAAACCLSPFSQAFAASNSFSLGEVETAFADTPVNAIPVNTTVDEHGQVTATYALPAAAAGYGAAFALLALAAILGVDTSGMTVENMSREWKNFCDSWTATDDYITDAIREWRIGATEAGIEAATVTADAVKAKAGDFIDWLDECAVNGAIALAKLSAVADGAMQHFYFLLMAFIKYLTSPALVKAHGYEQSQIGTWYKTYKATSSIHGVDYQVNYLDYLHERSLTRYLEECFDDPITAAASSNVLYSYTIMEPFTPYNLLEESVMVKGSNGKYYLGNLYFENRDSAEGYFWPIAYDNNSDRFIFVYLRMYSQYEYMTGENFPIPYVTFSFDKTDATLHGYHVKSGDSSASELDEYPYLYGSFFAMDEEFSCFEHWPTFTLPCLEPERYVFNPLFGYQTMVDGLFPTWTSSIMSEDTAMTAPRYGKWPDAPAALGGAAAGAGVGMVGSDLSLDRGGNVNNRGNIYLPPYVPGLNNPSLDQPWSGADTWGDVLGDTKTGVTTDDWAQDVAKDTPVDVVDTDTGEVVDTDVGEATNPSPGKPNTTITVIPAIPIANKKLDDITGLLEGKFPFCIPKDLNHLAACFLAEPAAPRLSFNLMGSDLTLDLSPFNDLAFLSRVAFNVLLVAGAIFLVVRLLPTINVGKK